MWVKICANTNLEDTQLAIDLGADAVGFVFAPSARQVTATQAGSINSSLREGSRHIERIGVFHRVSLDDIRRAILEAGLTGVQLHHEPDLRLIASLREEFGNGVTLAQTLHWPIDAPAGTTASLLAGVVKQFRRQGLIDRILVDAKVGSLSGGTGQSFDWRGAGALFQNSDSLSMIVAGGLNPENVGEAVDRLNPWGVDVASGVERAPGSKDPERLRLFLQRAQTARKTRSSS